MIDLRHKTKGFSLLEVLLVLAIMGTIMVGILGYTTQKSDEMRRDRTVMQIEQFLNAGLSYYVSFGSWPALSDLQGNFLPSGTILNPWGQAFSVGTNTGGTNPKSQFSVCTTIMGSQSFTAATAIAGRLPIASTIDETNATASCPPTSTTACKTASTQCTVTSSVNIPGQNINNARSINFAGLYHNGACVAAPVCPSNMTPSIMVVPVSVSGMNTDNATVYPISSFTAYATGGDASNSPALKPYSCSSVLATTPTTTPSTAVCNQDASTTLDTGSYWRVCVRIITTKGLVNGSGWDWAQDAALVMALTRCKPQNEDTTPSVSGSQFGVFVSD